MYDTLLSTLLTEQHKKRSIQKFIGNKGILTSKHIILPEINVSCHNTANTKSYKNRKSERRKHISQDIPMQLKLIILGNPLKK